MIGTRALIAGCIGALAFIANAHAADPPGSWPPPEFEKPAPHYKELMSGWYLRGDLGYRMNKIGSVDASNPVTSQKFPGSLGLTFGAGFKYQWFRTDVTFDYGLPVSLNATTAAATAQPQYSVRLAPITGLANFYVDLGTWSGFTPYVGAGLGATYLRSKSYDDTALPPNGNAVSIQTNFSWALMAGVAFKVQPTWLVDVGFRHLDLGDFHTSTGSNLKTDSTTWKKLSTDEVRIGLRYLFD
jgi:opacity protein-like surface antigen